MWIDQPIDINTTPAIYLAVNSSTTKAIAKSSDSAVAVQKLGRCQVTDTGEKIISPYYDAVMFYQNHVKNTHASPVTDKGDFIDQYQISVVKQPANGELVKDPEGSGYNYHAKKGYVGQDQFIIKVSSGRYNLEIHYTEVVVDEDTDILHSDWCNGKESWKISNVPTPNDLQTTITFANSIDAAIAQAFTGFTDLPGTSLGQATGPTANITLNLNPAGHG